jgi:hypothetical protein
VGFVTLMKQGLREERVTFDLEKNELFIFQQLLTCSGNYSFSSYESYKTMPVIENFKYNNFLDKLSPDNTFKILNLLADDDCAEIREKWRKVFLRHTQMIIEEIMAISRLGCLGILRSGLSGRRMRGRISWREEIILTLFCTTTPMLQTISRRLACQIWNQIRDMGQKKNVLLKRNLSI